METYADILFPLALDSPLTYRIPGDLADKAIIGMQVKAPVGQNSYPGIVWHIHKNALKPVSGETYKEIDAMEKSLPVIPEESLTFWEWIARYYMCPLGTVVKTALSLWKFKRRNAFTGKETILLPEPGKPIYINGIDRTVLYREYLQHVVGAGGQCLVLAPDRVACEQLYEALLPSFEETLICFHSKRTQKEQSRAQKELFAGNPCIVCGMHHALFLPFTRLGMILVDMEEHPGHKKQDATPHIHSRDTALMMGQMFRAQVVLGSVVPSLETYNNLEKGKFQNMQAVTQSHFSREHLTITDTFKSLRNNAMKGVLDVKSFHAAGKAIADGKTVLLVESDSDYLEDVPQDPGMILCRPYRMHHFLDEKTGMICFLHTEKLLSKKNFRATEQALQFTFHALTWAAAQKPEIPVFLQTSDLDHPFYLWLKEKTLAEILPHLMDERIRYGYPPHTRMISVTVSHYKKNTARNKASVLRELLIKENIPAHTEGPVSPTGTRKILFTYRIQIIIPRRVKVQEVKDKLSEVLSQHSCSPAQCRIDVDPV
jgi:primosomal protein N'